MSANILATKINLASQTMTALKKDVTAKQTAYDNASPFLKPIFGSALTIAKTNLAAGQVVYDALIKERDDVANRIQISQKLAADQKAIFEKIEAERKAADALAKKAAEDAIKAAADAAAKKKSNANAAAKKAAELAAAEAAKKKAVADEAAAAAAAASKKAADAASKAQADAAAKKAANNAQRVTATAAAPAASAPNASAPNASAPNASAPAFFAAAASAPAKGVSTSNLAKTAVATGIPPGKADLVVGQLQKAVKDLQDMISAAGGVPVVLSPNRVQPATGAITKGGARRRRGNTRRAASRRRRGTRRH